jgi:hypothetical protein
MNVLMTGFTSRNVGSKRLVYEYATTSTFLRTILDLSGFKVDQRAVKVGESLADYDAAVIGVCPPNSLSAVYWPGAAWAATKFPKRTLLFYEDWNAKAILPGTRSYLKTWDKRLKFFGWSFSPQHTKILQEFLKKILSERLPWPALASTFSWAKAEAMEKRLLPTETIIYDPSCFIPEIPFDKINSADRERRWTLATLQDHNRWVEARQLKWPIDHSGNRRQKKPFIPETEVVQRYAKSWGVLAPGYPSGVRPWFRPRFVFAARTRNVMLCDISDSIQMDKSYQIRGNEVEKLSVSELAALAERQATWFNAQMWSRDRAVDVVRKAIKRNAK